MNRTLPWSELETITHRDPAGRGLASYRPGGRLLDAGSLEAAARSLATTTAVGIVTGFCVLLDKRVTAETDGPPGALYLARALAAMDVEVVLISDNCAVPLLEAGCDCWGLPRRMIRCVPFENDDPDSAARASNEPQQCIRTDAWVRDFLAAAPGSRLTHLVVIERCGPSHTLDSLLAQRRSGEAPRQEFELQVPPANRNLCHNMRGISVNAHTAKIHRLMETLARRRPEVTTIGIGDGGNEIGLGSFLWEDLARAVAGPMGGRIACRVPADHTLIAGVSNWGGYALAAAVCRLRDQGHLLPRHDAGDVQRLLESMVRGAGAVDGITRSGEPTVDGLPLETELQTLSDIERIVQQA